MSIPDKLFELLLELTLKWPLLCRVIDSEFFSLLFHLICIRINNSSSTNNFIRFLEIMMTFSPPDQLVDIFRRSNFFFDALRLKNNIQTKKIFGEFPEITRVSENAYFFLRELQRICNPKRV